MESFDDWDSPTVFYRKPWDVYMDFLALRNHFKEPKYDFFKRGGGKNNMAKNKKKEAEWLELSKSYYFKEISSKYPKTEIIKIIMANFIAGDTQAGMYSGQYEENYKNYVIRLNQLTYNVKEDLNLILEEMKIESLQSSLECNPGEHPLIFRLFSGGHITLETIAILDTIKPFTHKYMDNLTLQTPAHFIMKYKPFLSKKQIDRIQEQFSDKIEACM